MHTQHTAKVVEAGLAADRGREELLVDVEERTAGLRPDVAIDVDARAEQLIVVLLEAARGRHVGCGRVASGIPRIARPAVQPAAVADQYVCVLD